MKYEFKIKKDTSTKFAKIISIMIYSVFYIISGRLIIYYTSGNVYVIMALVIMCFTLFIVPLFIFPMWCLTEEKFLAFQPKGIIEKWLYICKEKPSLMINISEIKKIEISYEKAISQFIYQEGYKITFHIFLFSEDEIYMDAMLNNDKKTFLEAIDFLKFKNIQIYDKYGILNTLRNDEVRLYDYLKKIEDTQND